MRDTIIHLAIGKDPNDGMGFAAVGFGILALAAALLGGKNKGGKR